MRLTRHSASRAGANGHFVNSDVHGHFHFYPTHKNWRVYTLHQTAVKLERTHHDVSKNYFNYRCTTVIKSEGGGRQEGKETKRE